ncbi:hypothetical protein BC939DRAFT_500042 [Gamsiella multidivaricata]|uniref:uncharacterized protein n=1 Tax=Gamsiella multidivaricata TaxID=101098 RepID=UPI002221126C|nr:uncharacterized protein BC939DRAFT_500042 [Gamsiella multidivaricata]KAI7829552.1 hypothetical protein BC939DRAFT_500042 [Gamsiella multidivaricata]
MEQTKGIITVVDSSTEQEDEALVALRQLPKASHFSLSSVFSSFSASSDSDHGTSEVAFSPNVLIDMLIQMNAHNKKCAQDIQDYQRSLGHKVRALDGYATGAVHELVSTHQQAKNYSDHLLSVHAITKQAQTTTTLLHGIIDKLTLISNYLPAEAGADSLSKEKYPNLYRYLNEESHYSYHHHPGHERSTSAGEGSDMQGSSSTPSGLALLGHVSPGGKARRPSAQVQQQNPVRIGALAIPKARASMALASSSMSYLPVSDSASGQEGGGHYASRSFEGPSLLLRPRIQHGTSVGSLQDQTAKNLQVQSLPRSRTPQPTTLRASDNLRRLTSKAPPNVDEP